MPDQEHHGRCWPFRAEHKEKQHDEDDGEADKKSRVDDLLHPEDDDLCF